jgi:hypothetical protein
MKNFYDYKVQAGISDNTLMKNYKSFLEIRFPNMLFRLFNGKRPALNSGLYEIVVMFETKDLLIPPQFKVDLAVAIHDCGPWKRISTSNGLDPIYSGVDDGKEFTVGSCSIYLNPIEDEDFLLLLNRDLFAGDMFNE